MRQLILILILIFVCTRSCNKTKRSLEWTNILKELNFYLSFLQLKTLVLMHPHINCYIILINLREVEARFCIAPYDACVQMLAKLRNVRFNLAKMGEILATEVNLSQASRTQLLKSTIWWSIKEKMRNETALQRCNTLSFHRECIMLGS